MTKEQAFLIKDEKLFCFLDFGNRRKEAGYYNYAGPAKYIVTKNIFAPTYFRQTFTLTLVQSEEGGRFPPPDGTYPCPHLI